MTDSELEIRRTVAIERVVLARRLAKSMLDDLTPDEWFRTAPSGATHIAWQVGHLAVAEFGLCIGRHRPETPDDEQLLPKAFRERFGRGSVPVLDAAANPSVDELVTTLDRVHDACLNAMASYPAAELGLDLAIPHPLFSQRIGALLWCSEHEMSHLGQIIMLRRFLGRTPKW